MLPFFLCYYWDTVIKGVPLWKTEKTNILLKFERKETVNELFQIFYFRAIYIIGEIYCINLRLLRFVKLQSFITLLKFIQVCFDKD